MEFLRLYSEMREKRVNKRESWKTKINRRRGMGMDRQG
jgi:hypothetical protein